MKKPDLYQLTIILLSLASILSVGFFVFNLFTGRFGKAALSVEVVYGKASVLVNGQDRGETPVYTEEFRPGEIKVDINGETNSYSAIIKPDAGTQAVIKRELGINKTFSAGENLWFTKIGGDDIELSVITPDIDEVSVIVDGVEIGKTPIKFATKDLLKQDEKNGKYNLTFKKDGYQDQTIDVQVKKGFQLNIRVDMFLKPIPAEISTIKGLPEGVTFINFSNVTNPAFTDKQAWAKAINYWLKNHGASKFGNSKVEEISYLISDDGSIYNVDGNKVEVGNVAFSDGMFVAYLGSKQNTNLSDEAKGVLSQMSDTSISEGEESVQGNLKIKPTGIGYLKVRAGPGRNNKQLATVDVGKTFVFTTKQEGWYKIVYEEGKEGWVSGTYIEEVKE